MASKLKAYVRYDGSGRIIPSSVILQRFKPAVGNWKEIDANECCNVQPPQPTNALKLTFDNITNVSPIVGDVSIVSNWNTYFDLPTYGNPFTSVSVIGNEVSLIGGSNIIIKQSLFDQVDELGTHLLIVNDTGCVIEVEYDAFGQDNNSGCENLVSVSFPNVIKIGEASFYRASILTNYNFPILNETGNFCFFNCDGFLEIDFPNLRIIADGTFSSCNNVNNINIPVCENLGSTVGNNNVFTNIIGNNITLTVPAALMTCNGGNPDGDIQDLQANNTVTIITT